MNCPFCSANIPQASELCPHCMSDLRAASPRGDRGTATDSGASAPYVPPRHGYVPPTQPGSAVVLPPQAAAALAGPRPATPVGVAPHAGPTAPSAYALPGTASGAPAPAAPATPASAGPAVPAGAPGYAPGGAPEGQAAVPGAAAPLGYAPVRSAGAPTPFGRETAPAPEPGRRRTALDSDHQSPSADAAARGRTRLDRDAAAPATSATPPLRRVVGWMISFDVNESGQEYVIREGRNTLGRSRDADISVFYDELVSATHATIVSRNGELKIRDEMTNNGTFVNGRDIGPGETTPLGNGDVLRVGRCTFKLFLLDPGEVGRLWPHLDPSR